MVVVWRPRLSDGDEIVYDDEGYLVTPSCTWGFGVGELFGREVMVKQVIAIPGDTLSYEVVEGGIYRLRVKWCCRNQ